MHARPINSFPEEQSSPWRFVGSKLDWKARLALIEHVQEINAVNWDKLQGNDSSKIKENYT